MKAKSSALELMSRMIAQYQAAKDQLGKYTGEDVYLRGVLTAQVEKAKKNLDALIVDEE